MFITGVFTSVLKTYINRLNLIKQLFDVGSNTSTQVTLTYEINDWYFFWNFISWRKVYNHG